MKANIIFLLYTRLGKGDEKEFERMWGGIILYNKNKMEAVFHIGVILELRAEFGRVPGPS